MTEPLDLLVVGAGPTGIAIGAEARRAGLVRPAGRPRPADRRHPGLSHLHGVLHHARPAGDRRTFPFTIPDDKPTRRQALAYYRLVVERYQIPLALYEDVRGRAQGGGACSRCRRAAGQERGPTSARAVAIATGYFVNPRRLGVPGEDLPWVSNRYKEPYPHFGQDVVVVGAGNTAAEAALDLWRNGVRVTLVHRGAALKPGVKYWLKPDMENRIEEGSIPAHFNTLVRAFLPEGGVEVETPARPRGPAGPGRSTC